MPGSRQVRVKRILRAPDYAALASGRSGSISGVVFVGVSPTIRASGLTESIRRSRVLRRGRMSASAASTALSSAAATIGSSLFLAGGAGCAGATAALAGSADAADFTTLAKEHAEAVRRGVFGVPTLVWPEGRSYYLKITDLIPPDRAVPLYDAIETVHRFGEVIEIKTPESEGSLVA